MTQAAAPTTLKLIADSTVTFDFDYANPSRSTFGHASVPGVLTVGSVFVESPDDRVDKSSAGPSTIRGAMDRQSLDVLAPEGVSVSGHGNFVRQFTGTSAAAPHVAGVAALLLSPFLCQVTLSTLPLPRQDPQTCIEQLLAFYSIQICLEIQDDNPQSL